MMPKLPVRQQFDKGEDIRWVTDAIRQGTITGERVIGAVDQANANYVGASHGITVL